MIERKWAGKIPAKHHIVMRDDAGNLLHEECLTRNAFDGPYTLMYHQNEPHRHSAWRVSERGWRLPVDEEEATAAPLRRRHFKSFEIPEDDNTPLNCRVPLLHNRDVIAHVLRPTRSDDVYFANADADDVYYIHSGGGVLRSVVGDLAFGARDYVIVPRGIKHRFELNDEAQYWVCFEVLNEVFIPKQWRTATGQLRMDAPYCHRDFRAPEFQGPVDEGIRSFVVKSNNRFSEYDMPDSPLDVVGWDGSVYPVAFHILDFQARAGLVHLPPDWHGTFAFKGGIICSFVPRIVDFHPEAIPCPYPHESVHCDEFLFYAEGNFVSRRGMRSGSISFHPKGIMHGPHPGAYEASIGHKRTDELAVMMDTFEALAATDMAIGIEDDQYHGSWTP